jgi:gas vesicle protein
VEKESSGPGFLGGLLAGSIIGLVLGFLLAPQSGERSREQLRGKMDELASLGKSAWEEGKEAASQKGAEVQAKFERARGRRG